MIKAGAGCSTNQDSVQAAIEAASQAMELGGLNKADWALVFSTFPHRARYREILTKVSEVAQTVSIAGCSAVGVLSNSSEIEGDPGVVVLAVSSDTMQGTPLLVRHSGDGGLKTGIEIGEQLLSIQGGNRLLTLFPDPFNIHPELLLRGVESKLGEIPVVGAAASEHPAMGETYEFCGGLVSPGAVSGLFLRGNFGHRIGITQGCQPVGLPCTITKVETNIIFELDGRPAFEVLKESIPASIRENPREIMRLVFAAFPLDPEEKEIKGGDYLVRNLLGFNPDTGIIGVAENVREGQVMSFTLRHPTMAREDLKQMLERLLSSSQPDKQFRFGFYFNCCARGSSLYGYQGIDTAYITQALGEVPIVGFFGNSELAPLRQTNYLFTYTGVLVLISE